MLILSRLYCVVLLLLVVIKLSKNASLSIHEQKKYKNLIEGQGLFSADDDVEILTNANFKKRIYGQSNAWLVEFYNSWCGFCQRFAPSWKALATDTKAWQGVVNIAAIDCADDDNNELCRDFDIMAYPTLRYFHENYVEGLKNIGDEVSKGSDVEGHKNFLIKHMINEQQEHKRGLSFPTLLPYKSGNVLHLFEGTNVNSKYVFLIIDVPESTLGVQLALDFQKYNQIGIRYASNDNDELVQNLKVNKYPYMMVITDQNKSHVFNEVLLNREALHKAIVEYVKPDIIINQEKKSDIFTGKWIEADVPDIDSLLKAKSKKVLRDKVKKMGDVVFQVDLETALKYSLKHEVGNTKSISQEKLQALRDYLAVLIKYFPFSSNGKLFLMELLQLVKSKTTISGSEIANLVKQNEVKSKNVFSSEYEWIACEGSSPERRGYPCGLWKMFHYLTVQASETNSPPKEVLHAMHGYIKNFFGCSDCSRHFQEMAERKDMESVSSPTSAVLWLWMAHNDVNKRLSGDATEDPEYPKYQFPSAESCPKCRTSESKWDYNEVLLYMKQMYNSSNIRYMGANSSVLHPEMSMHRNESSGILEQIDAKGISEKDVRT